MIIKIHNLNWLIEFVEEDDDRLYSDNTISCGQTYKLACKILLNKGLPKDLFERTVVHELTHAYIWTYGLEGINMGEEEVCNFIETHAQDIIWHKGEILAEYEKIC